MKNKEKRFKKFERTILKIRDHVVEYSRSHYISGSVRISLFDFFYYFITGLRNESINIRASSLAFKLFMSLFPALIFFVTLLPYFPAVGFQEAFLVTLQDIMPVYTFKAVESTIVDLLNKPRFGLLSVVFFLSLFYSIQNMNSILTTFNKSHHLEDKRGYLKKKFVSLVLTLLFFLIIMLAIGVVSFNKSLLLWFSGSRIEIPDFVITLLQYGRWLVLFFIMLTWLSLFYTIGTPFKIKFRFFSPGSVFSSFFFILISLGFNFFVNFFSNYNKVYGVLGVILVFFLWLYYNSAVQAEKETRFGKFIKRIQKFPKLIEDLFSILSDKKK